MTIRELLKTTQHRPWQLPSGPWKYYQEWNHAVLLHWQVDLDILQKFVPKALKIDIFEGQPWISVVTFRMEKIRPKNLLPSHLSHILTKLISVPRSNQMVKLGSIF